MAAAEDLERPVTPAELHALWRAGILAPWMLWNQQLRVIDVVRSLPAHVRVIVFLLARQFGKSVMVIVLALEECLQNPGIIVAIIGPKVDQARAIVEPRMKWLTRSAPKGLIRPLKAEHAWIFSNESELRLGGYSSGATSSRGKTLHWAILEEFGPDTDAEGYTSFLQGDLGPTLIHSKNARVFFPTTLPRLPDHPFITHTIPEAELHGAFFKLTIEDNEMLSREQKDAAIKAAGGRESIECKRELFCEIVRDPLLVVVPDYEDLVHVAEFDIPQYHYLHLTGDTGGVRDKTALLLHTYDFTQDRDLIIDELVFEPNTAASVYLKAARERWGEAVGDPDVKPGPDGTGFDVRLDALPRQLIDFTAEELNFHAQLVDKEDWQTGVNQMAERFRARGRDKLPKILIHPRCTFLRLSCRSGIFNKQRNDFARTEALGHCDALAALMYALRAQNRVNPWPSQPSSRDHMFQARMKPSEKEAIAKAFQPKSFGPGNQPFRHKKFGPKKP